MLNDLLNGIIQKIIAEYGEGTRVYTDTITDGLKVPCFHVMCVAPNREKKGERVYFDSYQVVIKYFIGDDIEEPIALAAYNYFRLVEILERVGSYAAYSFNYALVDNVLNVTMTYRGRVIADKEPIEKMEDMEHNIYAED